MTKDGKTYHRCTGPGHHGIPMWVVHQPGGCSSNAQRAGGGGRGDGGSDRQAGRGGRGRGRDGDSATGTAAAANLCTDTTQSDFRAHVAARLSESNSFGDDVSSLVDSIVSRVCS